MEKTIWHSLTAEQALKKLNSSKHGLDDIEVKTKRKQFGYNKLPEEKRLSGLVILLNQFKSPLVYVLIGAAVITFILQDYINLVIILLAIFINATLGFYQENKANKSVTYLRKLITHKAKVLRNGHEVQINAQNLVPGDIVFLEAGDKVPADCRLMSIDNLHINESTLTGESFPAIKITEKLEKGTALGDRDNMAFSGTVVIVGRGTAIVTTTGLHTQLGEIAKLVQETPEGLTPLQLQLASFSKMLTYAVLLISVLIIIIGKLQGRPIFGFGDAARESMLSVAAAVAVAAIPEGLLISVTAILAIGMQDILRRKALVRKLIAAETLGSVSVICTDKTGTLTEGRMQVEKIITADTQEIKQKNLKYEHSGHLNDHDLILKISFLCNNAIIENPDEELEKTKIIGLPTEAALLQGAIHAATPIKEIAKQQPRLAEIPFDSSIKYMATLNKLDDKHNVIYVKGAPEKIFEMCTKVRIGGKKKILTKTKVESLKKEYEKLTSQGLRLLAFGYKKIPTSTKKITGEDLTEMIFVGFVALKDPLRKEAKETIKLTKAAGIRPVIITGDHVLTAKAIAAELGMRIGEKNIITGEDLDKMSDEELLSRVSEIDVYARVEPAHKLRIIDAWQAKGEVVAMTGDGVNDAPALKSADIGIALGSGSEVTKEVADIILLDDHFKTIIEAIKTGRNIFNNIKKIILYLLTGTFSEFILIGASLLMGLPLPLLVGQILWVNIIEDTLPAMALSYEKEGEGVLLEKARGHKSKILDNEMKFLIFIIGITTNLILLGLFLYLLKAGHDIVYIRTMIFVGLGIDSLFYVLACKNLKKLIWQYNPFDNMFLNLSILFGWFMFFIALYVPFFRKILQTVPLSGSDWLILISLGLVSLILIEFGKSLFIHPKLKKV